MRITLPTTDNNKLLMPLKPFSIDFITRLFDEGLLWLFPEFFGGFSEGSSAGAKIKTNTQCRIFVKFVSKTVIDISMKNLSESGSKGT